MPKLKTKKGAVKRLRITKNGRIKHGTPGRRHLLRKKGPKRRRQMRKQKVLAKVGERRMRRLLGLGG
ncbi:MAG: 50S ribosomal protein L35 [Planctomycetes bacterium]|jgi:large subunit ribosomal protein L35|nr:50S ribosomal protein L35 [Planctomycetota bacterium]